MKKITKIILILCSLLCFACQKNDVVENQESISESDINSIQKNTDDSLPLWIPGNYSKLVVVFGHGYETEELQKPVVAELEKNFGLAENKGLIILRTFPENYFNGKNIYNALAAATCAYALGVPVLSISAGLNSFGGVSGRLQFIGDFTATARSGIKV